MKGVEIERKFLVDAAKLPALGRGTLIRQCYLSFEPVVRVRIAGDEGFLTIKGKGLLSRTEVETKIPAEKAALLFDLRAAGTIVVEKTRHELDFAGKRWEVDIFSGRLAGLTVAEIELASEEESFGKPGWVLDEVTLDPRYQNANLAQKGSL